jgi:hypothetical protein
LPVIGVVRNDSCTASSNGIGSVFSRGLSALKN